VKGDIAMTNSGSGFAGKVFFGLKIDEMGDIRPYLEIDGCEQLSINYKEKLSVPNDVWEKIFGCKFEYEKRNVPGFDIQIDYLKAVPIYMTPNRCSICGKFMSDDDVLLGVNDGIDETGHYAHAECALKSGGNIV